MDEELKSKRTNFLAYLAKLQYPQKSGVSSIQMDVMLLVLFAQMEGMNITVVHGLGVWASDRNIHHNIILVYKGNGEFLPTQKDIFKAI